MTSVRAEQEYKTRMGKTTERFIVCLKTNIQYTFTLAHTAAIYISRNPILREVFVT